MRGAGLLVALASALAAGPQLLRTGLADLRLALPLGLVAAVGSLAGALLGLALPAAVMQIALGLIIIGIVALMLFAGKSEFPRRRRSRRVGLAARLRRLPRRRARRRRAVARAPVPGGR